MNGSQRECRVSIADVSTKLPVAIWRALYAAAARTEHIPIVRICDDGRQFVLLEAEDFDRLQDQWEHHSPWKGRDILIDTGHIRAP